MVNNQEEIKKLIDKVKKIEKGEKLDLSSGEDLSVAVMNLVSIEEHLFFSGAKTGKGKYFDLLKQVREMRKELLKKLIKDYEGEVWCLSKHLLAACMRLTEVGTKALTQGKKEEAQEFFTKAYNLYNLFWGLNLGLVDKGRVRSENNKSLYSEQNNSTFIQGMKRIFARKEDTSALRLREIHFISDDQKPKVKATVGFFAKLGEIVQKVIDCCKE